MNFDLKKQNSDKLKNIILEHARTEIEAMQDHFMKKKNRDQPEPEISSLVMSNDRQVKVKIFHHLKNNILLIVNNLLIFSKI